MTTNPTLKLQPADQYAHVVPLPDPPPLPDAGEQYKHMTRADQTLETWLRYRDNTLVIGEGYLCFNRSDHRRTWVVPDCIVAFDVDVELYNRYNGYVINEMGKPPDLVMEVGSKSTGRRDRTTKRDQYANFGVGEYWRFDPTGGENYDRSLAGEQLVNGVYEPFDIHEETDGLIWGHSPMLGLDLLWDAGLLLFRNPETGEILLNQQQAQDALEFTQDQLAGARESISDAETRAAAAETRAAAAEAEAQQLREQLRRLQEGHDPE